MTAHLWPREHGAYVQLLVPIGAAIAIAPSAPGALLALAAFLAFLAHEPLRVAIGRRGKRARAEHGARARRRLGVELVLAAAAGFGALTLAPELLPVALVAATFAAAVVILACAGREHTLAGELLAAVALASAGAPIAMAGSASWSVALALWSTWALGFGATVVAVHAVLEHRRPLSWQPWALAAIVVAVALAATAWTQVVAAAPLVATSIVVTVVRPRPSRVRRIGVALAIAAGVSALLAIAAA